MSEPEVSTRPASARTAVDSPSRNDRQGAFRARPRSLEWLVPAMACCVLLLQLLASTGRLSQTADESTHLYAGYRYVMCRDFGFGPEHPPLARMVAALPLIGSRIPVSCATVTRDEAWEASDWLFATDFPRVLLRARIAVSLFSVGLCLLVWSAARRMFGFAAAAIAVLLLVFEPNVLAHGALVTTDLALTCTLFAAVLAFYHWTLRRSWPLLLLTGVLTGLTMVAKQSGILVAPILLLLAVADAFVSQAPGMKRSRLAFHNLRAVALIGLIAFGIVWCTYGFRFAAHPDGAPMPDLGAQSGAFSGTFAALRTCRLLPEAYLGGLQTARLLARAPTSPLILIGRLYNTPPWFYFPANMAVKYTVPSLALLLLTLAGVRTAFAERRRELLFLVLPAGFYLLICLTARITSGIRHVLPLMPFLLVFAAAGAVYWAHRARWAAWGIALVLALHLATSIHAYPFYLSYANELWGGPSRAFQHVPNNDWGEALYEVKHYLAQHPDQSCWLASVYLVDVRKYDLPCRQFGGGDAEPIPPHVHGTVILSAALFGRPDGTPIPYRRSGSWVPQDPWLAPFLLQQPTARLAGSAILVFQGDFDTTAAAAVTEHNEAMTLANDGLFDQALPHARKAAIFAPASANARFEYCRELVALGQRGLARSECRIARALLQEEATDSNSAAGLAQAVRAEDMLARGDAAAALPLARRGTELAPGSSMVHGAYCRALEVNQMSGQAAVECAKSMTLARNHSASSGWMGPVPSVGRLGFGPGWGAARRQLVDLMLYALGEE